MDSDSSYDFPLDALRRPLEECLPIACAWINQFGWDEPNDAVFELVRVLKAHARTRNLTDEDAYELFMLIARSRPNAVVIDGKRIESESFQIAFLRAWENVRIPMGVDPLPGVCRRVTEGILITAKKRTVS